jgi:hypothetical protein
MALIAWFFCSNHQIITKMVYHGYTDKWQAFDCNDYCQCVMKGRMNVNKVI